MLVWIWHRDSNGCCHESGAHFAGCPGNQSPTIRFMIGPLVFLLKLPTRYGIQETFTVVRGHYRTSGGMVIFLGPHIPRVSDTSNILQNDMGS